MKKYGVDTDASSQKKASDNTTYLCPKCGKKAKKEGLVVLCPEHGSEPFEEK